MSHKSNKTRDDKQPDLKSILEQHKDNLINIKKKQDLYLKILSDNDHSSDTFLQ